MSKNPLAFLRKNIIPGLVFLAVFTLFFFNFGKIKKVEAATTCGTTIFSIPYCDAQIQQTEDDAEQIPYPVPPGVFNYTGDHISIIRSPTSFYAVGGFRFQDIQIPPGSIITKAVFSGVTKYASDMNTKIYGERHDYTSGDAQNFADNQSILARPLTSKNVGWQFTAWLDETVSSPDLSGIIQEIIDQSGWGVNGHSIALLFIGEYNVPAATAYLVAYDSNPTKSAKLYIEYSSPPSMSSISNQDGSYDTGGRTLFWTDDASDPYGQNLRLYICQYADCHNCGPSDTSNCYASSIPAEQHPKANYPCTPRCEFKGSDPYYPYGYPYWAKVCNPQGLCSPPPPIAGGEFSCKKDDGCDEPNHIGAHCYSSFASSDGFCCSSECSGTCQFCGGSAGHLPGTYCDIRDPGPGPWCPANPDCWLNSYTCNGWDKNCVWTRKANLYGFAWSENVGWISFNSRNCDTNGDFHVDNPDCPNQGSNVPTYGVYLPPVGESYSMADRRFFCGFAWAGGIDLPLNIIGGSIGWINFHPPGIVGSQCAGPIRLFGDVLVQGCTQALNRGSSDSGFTGYINHESYTLVHSVWLDHSTQVCSNNTSQKCIYTFNGTHYGANCCIVDQDCPGYPTEKCLPAEFRGWAWGGGGDGKCSITTSQSCVFTEDCPTGCCPPGEKCISKDAVIGWISYNCKNEFCIDKNTHELLDYSCDLPLADFEHCVNKSGGTGECHNSCITCSNNGKILCDATGAQPYCPAGCIENNYKVTYQPEDVEPEKPIVTDDINSCAYSTSPLVAQGTNLKISWSYSDSVEKYPQESYEVQISNNSAFSGQIFDYKHVTHSTTYTTNYSYSVDLTNDLSDPDAFTQLDWSATYYYRVKVRDYGGAYSDWSEVDCLNGKGCFKMPAHAFPDVKFKSCPYFLEAFDNVQYCSVSKEGKCNPDISPPPDTPEPPDNESCSVPYDGETPLPTKCYRSDDISYDCPESNFSWTFQEGIPETSTEQDPIVQFTSDGDKNVVLTVKDEDGKECSVAQKPKIIIGLPLPEWREIPPF